MRLIVRTGLLALVAAALAAPLGACKKEGVPGGQVTPEVATLLGHLPADAALAFGANLAVARTSPLYAGFKPELPPELAALAERCKLDPFAAIDQLVGTTGDDLDDRDSVFVAARGSFTKEAVASCVGRLGETASISDEGGLTVYQLEGQKIHARWPAADTVIASVTGGTSPESMQKVSGGGPGAAGNQQLMAFVSKVDTSAAFWLAGPFPSSMRSQLVGVPGSPSGFWLSANPKGDGALVLLGLQLDSADVAEATAGQFRDQKKQLEGMMPDPKLAAIVGRVQVMQSGTDLAFKLELGKADIEHLTQMASGLLGGELGL